MDITADLFINYWIFIMGGDFTVTGASTLWTLDSSTKISLALAQRVLTSLSLMISQFLSCSICLSKSDDMEKKFLFICFNDFF